MNQRVITGELLVAKTIGDMVKGHVDNLKDRLTPLMEPGYRFSYVDHERGIKFGSVTMVNGSKRPAVVDRAAFLAWVRKAHPEQIVETVDPRYETRLLHAMVAIDNACDPDTGEVVPGVEICQGEPYISVRPDPALRQYAADRLLGLTQQVIEGPDA